MQRIVKPQNCISHGWRQFFNHWHDVCSPTNILIWSPTDITRYRYFHHLLWLGFTFIIRSVSLTEHLFFAITEFSIKRLKMRNNHVSKVFYSFFIFVLLLSNQLFTLINSPQLMYKHVSKLSEKSSLSVKAGFLTLPPHIWRLLQRWG